MNSWGIGESKLNLLQVPKIRLAVDQNHTSSIIDLLFLIKVDL